ncbi:hypothetical protein [Streptomonospora arabica]|uniref:Uncharacterized protein n=1 Tax=Streptomonospora arabica TaxID=412417 RepID=A0ABV9SSL1_9ACTN
MNRIRTALHEAYLTMRDFAAPPELEPAPAPVQPRAAAPEPHTDVVHPTGTDPTEDTVQAWLDGVVAPVPEDGCFHCDLPPYKHGVKVEGHKAPDLGDDGFRYAALVGKHQYAEPTIFQINQRRRAQGVTQ